MKKIKFLVADDANFIRDMIKKTIRDAFPNHELDEAIDGKRAQELIAKKEYDLIVSDWEMPNLSGADLLHWLRSESPHAKTPFIMVTSRGDRDHITTAIANGVNEYIIKPFNNEQLVTKLTKVLKKHRKVSEQELKSNKHALSTGLGGDSVAALTTHQKPKTEAAQRSSPTKSQQKKKPLGRLQLRTENISMDCLITSASTSTFQCLAKYTPDALPQIGQNIVMDIHQPDNEEDIARINAFVYTLSCRDKDYPPKFISLDLLIVDEDKQKQAFMDRFIAKATENKNE